MFLPRTTHRGLTMVELLVTLAILAIIVTLALPSMQQFVAGQRVRSAASDITADLIIARNEAIKRGESVLLAPATGGWSGGWALKVSSTSELLSSRNATGSGVTFTSSPVSVTYDKYGRLSGATSVVRFAVSNGASATRCVSIDPSGRPKSSATACPA